MILINILMFLLLFNSDLKKIKNLLLSFLFLKFHLY